MKVVPDNSMQEKTGFFTNILEQSNKSSEEEMAYKHLVRADALRIKNCFWHAIDEYVKSLEYSKDSSEAYFGLGMAYKQAGEIQDAIVAFNFAKRLSVFDKKIYFEIACCYCIDMNFEQAIKEFKKALKLSPDYSEAAFNLALAYELSGKTELAISQYLQIIKSNPENIVGYNALAGLYIKKDMYSKAINIFKQALKADKDFLRAYLGIAIAFDHLNEAGKAIRYYQKYAKLIPSCSNIPYIKERVLELRKNSCPKDSFHIRLVS